MIEYIKGTVAHIDLNYIVLESAGIGYQIFCGNPFQFESYLSRELQVFTHHYVREDQIALYGFFSREEKKLFERLLHVSGIGPKGALVILAAGTPVQVIRAIISEDIHFLTRFPGIGKKTAQRLILDLKDKLDDIRPHFPDPAKTETTSAPGPATEKESRNQETFLKEALEALLALGYSEKEISRIRAELRKQVDPDWGTDQMIKKGLQLLLKG